MCKISDFIARIFKMKLVSIYSKFYDTYLSLINLPFCKLHKNVFFNLTTRNTVKTFFPLLMRYGEIDMVLG